MMITPEVDFSQNLFLWSKSILKKKPLWYKNMLHIFTLKYTDLKYVIKNTKQFWLKKFLSSQRIKVAVWHSYSTLVLVILKRKEKGNFVTCFWITIFSMSIAIARNTTSKFATTWRIMSIAGTARLTKLSYIAFWASTHFYPCCFISWWRMVSGTQLNIIQRSRT